jgi:outer membrane protein assembly factor BamB
MGLAALLIIIVIVGSWLAFFVGVAIAIYRHAGRRGRMILVSGVGVSLLLIVSLVALNVSFRPSSPSTRPSPSHVILTATWSDSQGHPVFGGVTARDGSLRWRRSLAVSYRDETPTAAGVLYVEDGTTISAVRLSDGATLWQSGSPNRVIISPLMIRGDELIFVSYSQQDGSLANALDLTSHTLRWSSPLSNFLQGDQNRPLSSYQDVLYPYFAASADMLFFGSDDGAVNALRLSDGALAWSRRPTTDSAAPLTLQVTMGADLLFAYDSQGQIIALRPADGALVWSRPLGFQFSGPAHLTATDSTIYACASIPGANGGSSDALVALDPATGALRWERASDCSEDGINTQIESAGIVYQLGLKLTAMRVSDGAILWSANTLDNTQQFSDLGFISAEVDSGVIFLTASVIFPHIYTLCGDWWKGGPIFCHDPSYIAAFNATTGARYWRTDVGDAPRLTSGAAA